MMLINSNNDYFYNEIIQTLFELNHYLKPNERNKDIWDNKEFSKSSKYFTDSNGENEFRLLKGAKRNSLRRIKKSLLVIPVLRTNFK